MTEQVERAERDYEAALEKLRKSKAGDGKAEGVYGAAYHRLMVLGARPKLRRKYQQR